MKYFPWASMVMFVSGASILFWHYLEARGLQLRPSVHYETVAHIPLPAGYKRISLEAGSFGAWLRKIPLKTDNTVYLYNGLVKPNQSAQFAVLDISVGKKDLQQCADAVIRLYAEYLYASQQFGRIAFHATDGTLMEYNSWMSGYRFLVKDGRLRKQRTATVCQGRDCFNQFLQTVFSYAGTLSLSKELSTVASAGSIRVGDVFIRGGSPGHAVLVMDMAENAAGQKVFLLAQSYMPAQDIHILKSPGNSFFPWYHVASIDKLVVTPEWVFKTEELMRFR
ncbi:DUF4846 domain-containing protein [Chitinophaga sp. S165]|uniref:DUF4846 domain-containing protein n=1 Tax=Chitinophaga sp. S165 TaxID=2135462 RepID=UPI000D9D9A02|nr:DUF4846 domain-containing protein [Chitinophaga sp. S165]PWV50595.1 uncharacterized protein DUF4846 [Chitinophaga sp. S165]